MEVYRASLSVQLRAGGYFKPHQSSPAVDATELFLLQLVPHIWKKSHWGKQIQNGGGHVPFLKGSDNLNGGGDPLLGDQLKFRPFSHQTPPLPQLNSWRRLVQGR